MMYIMDYLQIKRKLTYYSRGRYCCTRDRYWQRCWSIFPLTIHCHDSHGVACVLVQSPHYHTALIGRHLTGWGQCAHSLLLSSLSSPPTTSGGCDHHMVHDVPPGLQQGERSPDDSYCGVIDMCDIHAIRGRRCCGDWEDICKFLILGVLKSER